MSMRTLCVLCGREAESVTMPNGICFTGCKCVQKPTAIYVTGQPARSYLPKPGASVDPAQRERDKLRANPDATVDWSEVYRRRDALYTHLHPAQLETVLAPPAPRPPAPKVNPLDVATDGVPLSRLLMYSEMYRREEVPASPRHQFTRAQRAAVSAHWSAQLRAKIAAGDADAKAAAVSVLSEGDE